MLVNVTGTYFGRTLTANTIYTIAGTGTAGTGANGEPLSSALYNHSGLTIDSSGNLYIADTGNHRVRKIFSYANLNSTNKAGITVPSLLNNRRGYIVTIAGTGTAGAGADGVALSSALNGQEGVSVDSFGNLYIAEYVGNRVRMIPKTTGTYFGISMTAYNIYTIAGTGTAGTGADGAPLTSALSGPVCTITDSVGNLYIMEYTLSRARMLVKVTGTYFGRTLTANNIYTIAGTGTAGTGANGAPLTSALNTPWGITIDSAGNLYIADTNNHRIRMLANVTTSYFGISMTLGNIYTIAGTGTSGSGADGAALTSAFASPAGITIDSSGNLYITDASQRIRMLANVTGTYFGISMTANSVYAIAGTGTAGAGVDGAPLSSALSSPWGICVDSLRNVYIVERGNSKLRMLASVTGSYYGISVPANNIYTIAGTGTGGTGADGAPLTSALSTPFGVAVDSLGNLYISDKGNNRVRMIAPTAVKIATPLKPNNIYTIAGIGTQGVGVDGPALSTIIFSPFAVPMDSLGNIYISEYNNSRIRMLARVSGTYFGISMTANFVYTLASGLGGAFGLCLDPLGNLYIADTNNNVIKMLANVAGTYFGVSMVANSIYTIAGGSGTSADGPALSSTLSRPLVITLDSVGNLYIADRDNHRVRMLARVSGYYFGITMTANYMYTIAGTGTSGTGADGAPLSSGLNQPWGVAVDSVGHVYIADSYNNRVRMLAKVTGTYFGISMTANNVYTIAGTGTQGAGADGAPLTSAVYRPNGVTVDSAGNLYIADTWNSKIRMIPKVTGTYFGVSMTANNIYTIAGTSSAGAGADGVALSSSLSYVSSVSVDPAGNLFIADKDNYRIRMLVSSGTAIAKPMVPNYIYTIAGTGTAGTGADGAPLSSALNGPCGVSSDSYGNLYIGDTATNRIRMLAKVTGTYFGISMTANNVYTIAGTGTAGTGANGAPLTSALSSPLGLITDSLGNLYMADQTNHRVRMLVKVTGTYFGIAMTANNIYTIAGTGTSGAGTDGAPLTSALNNPFDVTLDSLGNLYIAEFSNHKIKMLVNVTGTYFGVTMSTVGYIYTIAGTGTAGTGANGSPLTSALSSPAGVILDSVGNVYITDYGNNRLRMIAKVSGTYFGISMTANNIYTIAGGGASTANGATSLSSALNSPWGITIDSLGNLYTADKGNHKIKMLVNVTGTYFGISMTANSVYAIAGTGTAGAGADGPALSSALYNPAGITLDSFGNLYIADIGSNRIRVIFKGNYNKYTLNNTSAPIFNSNSGFLVNGVDAVYYNPLLYSTTF
jgi:uncharacterized protein YjiK